MHELEGLKGLQLVPEAAILQHMLSPRDAQNHVAAHESGLLVQRSAAQHRTDVTLVHVS